MLHDGARKQYSAAEFVAVQQQAHMKRAVVNNISLDICTSERAHRMARTKHTERKANDTSGMLRATKNVPKDGDKEGHREKKPPKESLKARKLKARIPAKCPVCDSDISVTETITETEIVDPALTETETMLIYETEII